MRVIDVDAHFHEPKDWLSVVASDLAKELGPPLGFVEALQGPSPFTEMLPKHLRPTDPTALITEEFLAHLHKTETLQPERYDKGGADPMYDGAARCKMCDEIGVDAQWLNPTFAHSAQTQAMQLGRLDLIQKVISSWNSWAAGQVAGQSDRLMPVTQTFLSDIDFTIAEMTRMRAAGSRAFNVTQNPQKSLTHPDYERMWSAAEDLGMAAYVHVFFGTNPIHPSFANNGRGLETYVEMGFPDFSLPTQQFITSMVFDGVLERHEKLAVVFAECGHSWLPQFLHDIDVKTRRIGMDGAPQNNFYKLPLKPSEYIQRQVRVSPLTGFVDTEFEYFKLKELFERVPHEILVYSSDFPHLEGRRAGRTMMEKYLPPKRTIRESFFGGSIAALVGM